MTCSRWSVPDEVQMNGGFFLPRWSVPDEVPDEVWFFPTQVKCTRWSAYLPDEVYFIQNSPYNSIIHLDYCPFWSPVNVPAVAVISKMSMGLYSAITTAIFTELREYWSWAWSWCNLSVTQSTLHEFRSLREREMKHFLSKKRYESSCQLFSEMSIAFELQLLYEHWKWASPLN